MASLATLSRVMGDAMRHRLLQMRPVETPGWHAFNLVTRDMQVIFARMNKLSEKRAQFKFKELKMPNGEIQRWWTTGDEHIIIRYKKVGRK